MTLEELDKLAQEFIIGHRPLTQRQMEIRATIGVLEMKLEELERTRRRIERIIAAMWQAFVKRDE